MKKYLLPILSILLATCTQQDSVKFDWEELNSGINATLTSVSFSDAKNGYIAGGNTWYNGYVGTTHDGGNTWKTDSVWYNQMYGVYAPPKSKKIYAVGMFSRFLKKDANAAWQPRPLPKNDIWLRDIVFRDENHGIAVGGAGFQNGPILLLGKDEVVLSITTFAGELASVCFSDSTTAYAVGYGTILRSKNAGKNWIQHEMNGDFFQCVHFPTPQVGYIVGYHGTILKTINDGITWQILRDGRPLTVSDLPFRSVFFKDEYNGYIVGDVGLFWRTVNGGRTWQAIEGFPKIDLYDVFVVENTGYIVGEKGKIFRFRD
jgi:photosystem II stability/assembly factor-like uncharacterized protein